MKTIRQKAYFRQRVLKEVMKGKRVTEVARLYRISRTSIYRWRKRYDGSVESLYEGSHRPHSHPNQHTAEEIALIKRVGKLIAFNGVAPKILCILRKPDNFKWFRGARFILALYRYRNTAAMGGQGF